MICFLLAGLLYILHSSPRLGCRNKPVRFTFTQSWFLVRFLWAQISNNWDLNDEVKNKEERTGRVGNVEIPKLFLLFLYFAKGCLEPDSGPDQLLATHLLFLHKAEENNLKISGSTLVNYTL